MRVLALDVDGVLLDVERGGDGHWTNELERRHGITRTQLRDAFFLPHWNDVVNGRRPIESALSEALGEIDPSIDVETVLACWFEADFVIMPDTIDVADRAAAAGCRVTLATNQEHRRATFLEARFATSLRLDSIWYSAALGVQKPERQFFNTVANGLDVAPNEIVFVDDVELNVARAREAGWLAIHAHPSVQWHRAVIDLLELG